MAKDLYTSPLFQYARAVAEKEFDAWFILSALHGLVAPETEIRPYNDTLNTKSPEERKVWSQRVFKSLRRYLRQGDVITFFAGDAYRQFLTPLIQKAGFECEVPLLGLGLGQQIHTLKLLSTETQRIADIDRFYSLLDELRSRQGVVTLASCNGSACLPRRGIYLFFEVGEKRLFHRDQLRCTRIGTHAVSRNSSSTLWNRLRTHRGGADLSGNHRSSIFRLHVGAAILAKNGIPSHSTWGVGQNADAATRVAERSIEEAVSKYIAAMQILWIPVADEAGPTSDRSFLERNAIGLLTGGGGPLDLPSRRWLGSHSTRALIRTSGLWNINYIGEAYHPQFLDVMTEYVRCAVGSGKPPDASIAPSEWYSQSDPSQLPLFDHEL